MDDLCKLCDLLFGPKFQKKGFEAAKAMAAHAEIHRLQLRVIIGEAMSSENIFRACCTEGALIKKLLDESFCKSGEPQERR